MSNPAQSKQSIPYTPEARAYLRANYTTSPRAVLLAAFPGRTWTGLQKLACKMGIAQRPHMRTAPKPHWSDERVAFLEANYPAGGSRIVADFTGFSCRAVLAEAGRRKIAFTGLKGFARPGSPRGPRVPKAPKIAKVKAAPKVKATPAPKPKPTGPLLSVKRSAGTPNLNVQKESRKQQEAAAKKAATITADEIRKLPYNHPGRMAYSLTGQAGWAKWQAQQPA